MDETLIQAYRNTDYCLWLAGNEYVLKIDTPAPEAFAVLTGRLTLEQQAFIVTPCNPRSERTDIKANRERLAQFREQIRNDKVRWLPSVNRDPNGQWPEEPGALLIDCTEAYARELGQDYGQNAIVSIGLDAIPKLVVLDA